jgi:hypothetical protein
VSVGKDINTSGRKHTMKKTATELKALGFEVIENEMDYVPTLKELYDEIYGVWAGHVWEHNVANKDIKNFNCDALRDVFGNYDVLAYTTIETATRKVAFLNREHYFMDGTDEDKGTLAIVHLHGIKTLEPDSNTAMKFELKTNV